MYRDDSTDFMDINNLQAVQLLTIVKRTSRDIIGFSISGE